MHRRIAILAGLLCLLVGEASAVGANRYLVVRYDDYAPLTTYAHAIESGQDEPTIPPSGDTCDLEARLFELFQRHQARIVVGVIPFPIHRSSDPPKPPTGTPLAASWLADADNPWVTLLRRYVANGTVEPALHGYEHRRRTQVGHRPGEFAGQPSDWQLDAIRLGRDALSRALDGPVQVFVPPWNSWDAGTARALNTLGFAWCSADAYHADYENGNVRLVPQTASEPSQLLAFLHSRPFVPPGSILVLTTHPFDFAGPGGQSYFRSLEALLQEINDQPDWACVGLADLPAAPADVWHERFRRAVAWSNTRDLAQDMVGLSRLVPPSSPVYASIGDYTKLARPWRVAVGAVLLVSAGLGWLAGWLVSAGVGLIARRHVKRSSMRLALLAGLATLVMLVGAISVGVRGYHVRGVRWQAVCVAAGLSLGLASVGVLRHSTPHAPYVTAGREGNGNALV